MGEVFEQLREEAVNYFNESLDLFQAGKLEEAMDFLQKAENAAYEAKDGAVLLHTLILRSQILQSLGNLEESLETYIFSLKASEKLLEADLENDFYFDVFQMSLNNIGNLGNIFRRMGNFLSSKKSYEIGLEICQKRLEFQPENNFCQLYTGNTHNNLGELLAEMGQPEEAKENYEEALKIYVNLLKKYPEDLEYLSDTAMTLNNLGILSSKNGQKEKAKENFKKALEILENLSKVYPENRKVKEELNFTRKKFEHNV